MILLVLVFAWKFVFPQVIPIACVCACVAGEDHVYMTYMFTEQVGGRGVYMYSVHCEH